jgi:hypothetical protein
VFNISGFVHDDFLQSNGRDGEKAYTLERLRQEERLMNIGIDPIESMGDGYSQKGSNYDLVEEVYENMNSFDKRMKETHRHLRDQQ